jgi:TonB family protein
MLPADARAMFEDSTQAEGARRRGGWPLAASALLHLAAVAALALGAGRGPAVHRGERQIDVVFLREALESGSPATAAPASPAERRAARERQAMLDRLVQPTIVPETAIPGAAAKRQAGAGADPAGGTAAAEPDLPVAAGGNVTGPEIVESSRVRPDYPEAAQRAGLEGQVVLRAVIDRQGRARDVQVMRGLGLGLDEAAVAAVRRWKFRPATRYGSPVEVVYILSVYFRLEAPEGASPSPPAHPPAGARGTPPAPPAPPASN